MINSQHLVPDQHSIKIESIHLVKPPVSDINLASTVSKVPWLGQLLPVVKGCQNSELGQVPPGVVPLVISPPPVFTPAFRFWAQR